MSSSAQIVQWKTEARSHWCRASIDLLVKPPQLSQFGPAHNHHVGRPVDTTLTDLAFKQPNESDHRIMGQCKCHFSLLYFLAERNSPITYVCSSESG